MKILSIPTPLAAGFKAICTQRGEPFDQPSRHRHPYFPVIVPPSLTLVREALGQGEEPETSSDGAERAVQHVTMIACRLLAKGLRDAPRRGRR